MRVNRAALLAGIAIAGAAIGGCEPEPGNRISQGCEIPPGAEPVTLVSAKRRLHGLLDLPDGPGPHPAVLLLHDSGQTDVTRGDGDFAKLRDVFRAAGIASFVWDQAGSGCSGGRYRGLADLYVRSDDVLAAVEMLEAHPRLDAARIGAWALGEGVWAAAMAAARGDLDFLILVGGPSGGPIDRIRHSAELHLASRGYAAEEASYAASKLADALEMMRDQAPYREYRAAIDALSRYPLFSPMSELGRDVHANERRYDELRESAVLHVDVDVFLTSLAIPVLAVWGDEDADVDWRRASGVYRKAFERGVNDDASVRVFNGADHALCAERTDAGCRLAEGYVESMIAWLNAQGFAGGGERQSRVVPAEERTRP